MTSSVGGNHGQGLFRAHLSGQGILRKEAKGVRLDLLGKVLTGSGSKSL